MPPFRSPTARTFSRQVHDFFLVLDLEATCTKRRDLFPIEIIELSALLLDAHSLSTLGEFQSFVRPTVHPCLDPFCVELTGIEQQQVDTAPLLSDVLPRLHSWLEGLGALQGGISMLPVTWTDWDLKICLETECEWRKLPRPPYLRRWCNLKRVYTNKYRRTNNLRKCVEAVGLQWQGRVHSGLDDSRNTAALAAKMIRDGCVLRVTDSFKDPPPQQQQQQQPQPETRQPHSHLQQSQPQSQPPASQGDETGPSGGPQGGAGGCADLGAENGDEHNSQSQRNGGPGVWGGSRRTGEKGGGGLRQTFLAVTARDSPGTAAATATPTVASPGPEVAGDGVEEGAIAGGKAASVAVGMTREPPSAEAVLYDSAGRWLGKCRCGVAAHFRTTKKPGANLGRQFYSCGRWTISDRSRQCDFFAWADQLALAPSVAAGVVPAAVVGQTVGGTGQRKGRGSGGGKRRSGAR